MVVYMKKIVCLLVAIIFFSCDHQYDNFKITGINMHAVTFNDSIRSKKRYFLIDFTTVLCHPKSTLFGGGVEPGLKGIDEGIKSIDIYTRNGKTISSHFKGWNSNLEGTISDGRGDYSYLSSSNIAELVKSINDRDRQGIGERIKFRRLFYTNSEETPYKIVIRFENREITAKVINDEEDYKVISTAHP